MYEVINDRVERCDELPAPEGGAPNPFYLGLEGTIVLAYRMCKQDPRWEEKWTTLWTDSDEKVIEACFAVVRFNGVLAHYSGAPSEEATPGHPLYERGLERLTASEVFESSWIKAQKQMDSVSPSHANANFDLYRHFYIGFHESSFECIAINTTVKSHYGDIDFTDLVALLNES